MAAIILTTTRMAEGNNMKIHGFLDAIIFHAIFATKYRISTPLIMENPVRSPMVPPMADNMSVNFAALSLVIL